MVEPKGVIATFECAQCGASVQTEQLLKIPKSKSTFTFVAPTRCVKCGGKAGFEIMQFCSASGKLQLESDYPE
jgi:NAD-dependent SIR2 family protein deacetylase